MVNFMTTQADPQIKGCKENKVKLYSVNIAWTIESLSRPSQH